MSLLVENRSLLESFRRGDRAALGVVFDHYASDVANMLQSGFSFSMGTRSCRFMGFRRQFDVDDMLHEVFLRAFSERARTGYDGLRPYKQYLLAIARNVVVDSFRSKQATFEQYVMAQPEISEEIAAEPSENSAELLEGTVGASGDPGRDVEHAELAGLLTEFRASLQPDENAVFRLRFQEAKSLADVERLAGLSPSVVKTMERKLRERLLHLIWSAGYLDDFRPRQRNSWLSRLIASLTMARNRKEDT